MTSEGLYLNGEIRRGSFTLQVDLAVAPGEVLAILGPNGAGKSSLLRSIAGLAPLTSGRLVLDGRPMDEPAAGVHLPPERRPVAVVFQDYRLFPHLSVLDNAAFAPRSAGAGKAPSRQSGQQYLDQLGIGELADRRPAQISGGQAQRVALARALASRPTALLMDEPLAALDSRTRLETRSALRRYLADFAGPVIVVTHDPVDALALADRIVVLEDGRVVQDGRPSDVASRPRTQYLARLMGLNLHRGRVDPTGRWLEVAGGGRLPVDGFEPGAEVLAVWRPSTAKMSVVTSTRTCAAHAGAWTGRIQDIEIVADRARVLVVGDFSAYVDVPVPDLAQLAVGDEVHCELDPADVTAYP